MHAPLFAGSPKTTAQSTTARAKSFFIDPPFRATPMQPYKQWCEISK